MSTHDWRELPIAASYDKEDPYPAMALVAGESVGASVHVDQCTRCPTIRIHYGDDEVVDHYAVAGVMTHVEPICTRGEK